MASARYKVGDMVVANRNIHIPFTKPIDILAGDSGKIIKVGPDAKFGWYVVEFSKLDPNMTGGVTSLFNLAGGDFTVLKSK